MLLVTGGAGFIGANFVVSTVTHTGEELINLDKLTYAGNVRNLDEVRGDRRHQFVHGDIADRPLVIRNALAGEPLPVYGDGSNVRDWLYVADHCDAVRLVLAKGKVGETYNIGGETERANIDVVRTICALLDRLRPRAGRSYAHLIQFVTDRPGHDRRYAMNIAKIRRELGWQ